MTDLIPQRLALLIDIDNGSAAAIDGVLAELERYGRSDIRLGFGDYEHTSAAWREACIRCAIELRHYPVLAMGSKNAADIALVIAAMDLLHGGGVDGFAIVSSDTDFVRLGTRIREAGLPVYGFGPWGTSERFRKACTRFLFSENLMPDTPAHPAIIGRRPLQEPRDAGNEIRDAIARLHPGVGGWVGVEDLDRELVRHAPDFDPRTYGKRTLLELLKAQRRLTVSQYPVGHWRVRLMSGASKVGGI
ncbi:NYN domain-containing protein [Aquibium sp. ELW1220]|uniref:NYN domain-containing protein n=1 Tax=Aquibium sp. ELW1220 TaxID=2976766 RepID=UPI0025B15D92|nr:NYN domain-containing protein [Aquibium sp. ELW1220]MDN2580887.1 NYN domain-containing protein [Aquibium sp. ELW1220]